MHFSANARSWDRMFVRLSVTLVITRYHALLHHSREYLLQTQKYTNRRQSYGYTQKLAKTHSVQSNSYTSSYSDPTSDTKCEDRWMN